MRRIPLLSIAALTFLAPCVGLAQDGLDEGAVERSTSPNIDAPNASSATPYSESFSSGEPIPAPPVSDEPTPEKNPDADPLNDASNDALPDNFRIGVTGALEIPHIVNFGIDALMMQKYGLAINRGSVSRNINGIDVSVVHTDLRFRYHPWGGSFFGGIALGQHILTGDKSRDNVSVTYNGTTVKANANIKIVAKSSYAAPHIGWFAIWEPGFTMGLDLGWLFPFQTKVTTDDTYSGLPAGAEDTIRNTPEYAKLKSDLTDSVEAYAKRSWPFMTMIRMGWMF